MKNKIINNIKSGIIILLPIGIIAYALSTIITVIDWIESETHLDIIYKKIDPWWGMIAGKVITIVAIMMLLMVINFIAHKVIKDQLNGLKKKIPFYNNIESITKSIVNGINKESFKGSAWVWYQNRWELGLITHENDTMYNVVVQYAFGFNGQTFPLEKKHVHRSTISTEKVIAYKMSGGIANVEEVMRDFQIIKKRLPME